MRRVFDNETLSLVAKIVRLHNKDNTFKMD